MSGIFGGGKPIVNETPHISALRFQTSCYGGVIPVVIGLQRCTGNLIYCNDLKAIRHEQTQSAGGKGGGTVDSTTVNYTYTYSLQVGVCEGPVTVGEVWMMAGSDKLKLSANPQYGYSINVGTTPNTYSSILADRHPDQFFHHPGLCNLTAVDFGEFTGETPPSFSFEVLGFDHDATIGGADPAAALYSIITDTRWGAAAPAASFPLASAYGDYAVAMGWALGLEMAEQRPAADWVQEVLTQTNSAAVWAADHLEIVPYGDAVVYGNGRTWMPSVTPIFDLTDDDFIGDQDAPIVVTRKADSEAWNIQAVEFRNGVNEYNIDVIEGSDPAAVAMFGPKKNRDTLKAHGIKTPDSAARLGQVVVQRNIRARNTYEFTLPWSFVTLLPMDIVTLTDPQLGMDRYPVRLTRVTEGADLTIRCEAEDFPAGAGHAALIERQAIDGWNRDVAAPPGDCNPPIIFDSPLGLLDSANRELWIGTSGGEKWGGAVVYLSTDGTSYRRIGTINRATRHGLTTATLPAVADPDTTSTLSVDLSMSASQMHSGTSADAQLLSTLCWLDGEFLSYETATLTGDNQYDLTSLRRGALSSPISEHAAGSPIARIDKDSFLRYTYNAGQIPAELWIKLCSYNIHHQAPQALEDVAPIHYIPSQAGSIRYDSWLPVPMTPEVFATADESGRVNHVKVRVTLDGPVTQPIHGLALFYSAFPFDNSILIESGGTGTDLVIDAVGVLNTGTLTVLAGSTTSHIVTTTTGAPLDTSANIGGRYWAILPGGEWRKCTGIDETGFFFNPPHDVTPGIGDTLTWAEVAWADERAQGGRFAYLTDGTNYEIIKWGAIDETAGVFSLTGCERGQEGTTPISADGTTLHYYPAPGPGTAVVDFPVSAFAIDGGTYVGETDVSITVPPGYWASLSVCVYTRLPDGGFARSAIVPAVYGGPL